MKNLLACLAATILFAISGCTGPMRPVLTLDSAGNAGAEAQARTINVTEKGTYSLYSSKAPNTPLYVTPLKKGEELGFRVKGDRAVGVAAGRVIELSDYAEGATYTWKTAEK